jgi:hypothetical protein
MPQTQKENNSPDGSPLLGIVGPASVPRFYFLFFLKQDERSFGSFDGPSVMSMPQTPKTIAQTTARREE